MIYFRSDDHLMHRNICLDQGDKSYTQRHKVWGDSTEDMTYGLIENHNSVVEDEDMVYFLGDVVMGKVAESLPLLSLMKGRKRLILGNHDRPHPCNKKTGNWFAKYYEYFEWIGIQDRIEIAGRKVALCHFPYKGDSHDKDRFGDYRPEHTSDVLLHGHVHSEKWDFGERMIHIGVDSNWLEFGVKRYHPIPITAIEAAIKLKGY